MGRWFLRAVLGSAALAAAVMCGAFAESRVPIAGRATGRDPSLSEMKLVSEFAVTKSFGEAPDFVLRDLASDGLPLAREFRARLNTTTLDANGTEAMVAGMLVSIAGDPKDGKDTFMLQTVLQCAMFGVEYGRFTALRRGVTDDGAVDGMVTAYASSALDGLLSYLAELPQPEAAQQSEAQQQQPEAPPDPNGSDLLREPPGAP